MNRGTTPSVGQGEKAPPEGSKAVEFKFPLWKCEFEDVEKFTVGDKKKLVCHGDYVKKLREPIKILAGDKRLKFVLHPLELISAENESVTLLVTSYKSGKFSGIDFVVMGDSEIVTGASGFRVESFSWEVQSVIENQQMPRAFGPSPPLYLKMPWWFWGGWGFAIVLVGVVVGYKFIRFLKRKKLIESLATHNTSLSPYKQYHREMRQLTREYQSANYMRKVQGEGSAREYFFELDRVLRLYFVRQLQIPALSWGSRQVIGEVKHRHKLIFKNVGLEIEQTLREFEKAVKSQVEVGMVDCNQFHQMSRRVVEQIHQVVER